MRNFLTVIARIIAGIFAAFFVITSILSILLSGIGVQVFKPEFYKSALEKQQVYTQLPVIAGNMLITLGTYNPCEENPLTCENISNNLRTCFINGLHESTYNAIASGTKQATDFENQVIQGCIAQFGLPAVESSSGAPPFLQNLKATDWEVIIENALPPADIKLLVEGTIDSLFAYLNGESDSVSTSLLEIKKNLSGPAGQEIITQLLSAQPPCTVDQIVQITLNAATGGILVLCSPPDAVLLTVMPFIQEQLTNAISKIPDSVQVIKPQASGESTYKGPLGNDIGANFRLVRNILRFSFVVPVLFLLLVTLFAIRSIKSWMRWWGIPIFVSGLLTLGISLTATPLINFVWTNFLGPKFPVYLPADLASLAKGLVNNLANGIFHLVMVISLFCIITGLAAWVISYFIKPGKKTEIPENTSATL